MPATTFNIKEKYEYQSGFGSYHEYVSTVCDLHLPQKCS